MKKLLLSLTLLTSISVAAQTNTSSISFDGVDDYLETPSQPSLNSIVDSISLMAWFKTSSDLSSWTVGSGTIIARRDFVGNPEGERHHFELGVTPDSSIYFGSANNQDNNLYTTQVYSDNGVITPKEWTHVGVTFNNGKVEIYVNGSLVTSQDLGFKELFPYDHWINIGRIHRTGGNQFFNEFKGQLDDIAIWHRVLSQEEVQLYMNCPPDGSESNLVAFYNMEEGTGTTTQDLTPSSFDMTFNNGPTWSTDVPAYNCNVGIEELSSQNKEAVKIVNLLGQEVEYTPNTVLIYIYSDGTSERVMKIEE